MQCNFLGCFFINSAVITEWEYWLWALGRKPWGHHKLVHCCRSNYTRDDSWNENKI